MLELYNFPASTCSQKVRICLAEKNLEWVDRRLDSAKGDHLRPEYLALNPNGVVPTLVHDGNAIIDSSVICEYLDEVFPDPPLSPADPVGRARMRKWLRYFEEVPTPAVRYPSFQKVLIRNFAGISPERFAAAAEARPLRKHFYRSMALDGFGEEEMAKAFEDLADTVRRMEDALAGAGPWLMGAQYTIADICVYPTLDRIEDLGDESLWEARHPSVTAWVARMKARPAVQAAFYAGSRFSDLYTDLGLGRSTPAPAA